MKDSFSIFLLLLIIVIAMSGCTGMEDFAEVHVLPALEVPMDGSFTPKEGLSISSAEKLAIEFLKEEGTKGDISSSITLSEITTRELWESENVQLYIVELDYAMLNGVMIMRGGKVLALLPGMPTENVFLADLDGDALYEVYTNSYFGSGIVSLDIHGYNVASDVKYFLSMRMKKDLLLFVQDGTLFVKNYLYGRTREDAPESICGLEIHEGKGLELVATNKGSKEN